jgi:hypothetical protein
MLTVSPLDTVSNVDGVIANYLRVLDKCSRAFIGIGMRNAWRRIRRQAQTSSLPTTFALDTKTPGRRSRQDRTTPLGLRAVRGKAAQAG